MTDTSGIIQGAPANPVQVMGGDPHAGHNHAPGEHDKKTETTAAALGAAEQSTPAMGGGGSSESASGQFSELLSNAFGGIDPKYQGFLKQMFPQAEMFTMVMDLVQSLGEKGVQGQGTEISNGELSNLQAQNVGTQKAPEIGVQTTGPA